MAAPGPAPGRASVTEAARKREPKRSATIAAVSAT